jgi:hypothetical protein
MKTFFGIGFAFVTGFAAGFVTGSGAALSRRQYLTVWPLW